MIKNYRGGKNKGLLLRLVTSLNARERRYTHGPPQTLPAHLSSKIF